MPLRTVYEIDINDAAWQKFAQQYREYQSLLEKSPAEWRKVTDAIGNASTTTMGLATGTLGVADSMRGIADESNRAAKGGESFGHLLSGQSNLWRGMAHDAKSFTTSITDATRQLLRWGELTGLISSILGGGGVFGIDRLAISAGSQRRSSLGLGVSTGEQKAMQTDIARLVDPNALMSGVNEALHDPTKSAPFYNLGLDPQSESAKGTFQASLDVMQAFKGLMDRTDPRLRGNVISAYGLNQFGFDLESGNRVAATSGAEVQKDISQTRADATTMNFNDQTAKAWQDLQVQMKRAGAEIETVFITGLAPLTPELTDLSKSFVGLVDDFMKSGVVKDAIGELDEGLKWLDGEINKPEFRQGLKDFSAGLIEMAKEIYHFVRDAKGWLDGSLPGPAHDVINHQLFEGQKRTPDEQKEWDKVEAEKTAKEKAFDAANPGGFWGAMDRMLGLGGDTLAGSVQKQSYMTDGTAGGPQLIQAAYRVPMASGMMRGNIAMAHDFFRDRGLTEAQTAGVLGNIQAESGFDPSATNSSGMQGMFQWDSKRRATFERLFGHPPAQGTAQEQLQFAWYELQTTERATLDRLRQAGSAGQAADIWNRGFERSGTDSGQRAAYANQFNGQFGDQFKDRSVRVQIQNNTGGSVNVSATQLVT